jgi:hypothetical protein
MVSHRIPPERRAAVGRCVRRTLSAILGGELGVLAPDTSIGEHLAAELAGERLAIVSTSVAADIAADLPRLPRAPIAPRFWQEVERARGELALAIAEAEERLRVLNETGLANEAAAQLYAVLDAATEAVREVG